MSQNKLCMVCLEPVLADEEDTTLPCAHVYHKQCFEDYTTNLGIRLDFANCPQCRRNVGEGALEALIDGEEWDGIDVGGDGASNGAHGESDHHGQADAVIDPIAGVDLHPEFVQPVLDEELREDIRVVDDADVAQVMDDADAHVEAPAQAPPANEPIIPAAPAPLAKAPSMPPAKATSKAKARAKARAKAKARAQE